MGEIHSQNGHPSDPDYGDPSHGQGYIGDIQGFMCGCQNYGPVWDPYYNTAPNI